MNPHGKIPAHLPKRLTISFPIWGLFDTGNGAYHDLDRFVKEHVERGFNCIRLEGGAGLTHDLAGNRRGPIFIHAPFGEYSKNRQCWCFGGEGECDVLARMIELCEACKKYGVYLIISSWYFLHTYWYLDTALNEEILKPNIEDMFMVFARYLHYVLCELEARGLSDRIAMAEIFNEISAVPTFIGEFKGTDISGINFTAKHEEAIAWLREQHPDILFSVDNDNLSDEQVAALPKNLQGFNGHNYFLWGIYGGTLEKGEPVRDDFFLGKYTAEDIKASRKGLLPLTESCSPWYDRMARCNDLDTQKIPELEAYLEKRLAERRDEYLEKLDTFCDGFKKVMARYPDAPVVCGEGVAYCSSIPLLFEEHSDAFWDMAKIMMQKYKETGLWGTVIKTLCGPEDGCWTLRKDKLKELNDLFLADE